MPKNPAYRIRKKRSILHIDVLKRSKSARLVVSSLILTGIFSLSVLVLGGGLLYKSFQSSFVSAFSSNSQDLSSLDIFTLMQVNVSSLNDKEAEVLGIKYYLFQKNTNKLVIYTINPKTVVDMPGNLSDEEIGKAFRVGMMNEGSTVGEGTEFLRKSVSKIFGFKVDKFILVNGSYIENADKLFETGLINSLTNLKSIREFQTNVKTDMTIRDLLEMQKFLSQLPEERVYKYNFSETYITDPTDLDSFVRDFNSDSAVEHEALTVSVLNGSGKGGFASFGARVVENMNVRVVSVGNSDALYQESLIITSNKGSETVSWLQNTFGITKVVTKEQVVGVGDAELDRSDIVVILGFDKASELY